MTLAGKLDSLWENPHGVDLTQPLVYRIEVTCNQGHFYGYIGKARNEKRLDEYRRNMLKIEAGRERGETQKYRAVHFALYQALTLGWQFRCYPLENASKEMLNSREQTLIGEYPCNLNNGRGWRISDMDGLLLSNLVKRSKPTLRDLLQQRAQIDAKLKGIDIIRNHNNPIADIAEQIVARVLDGQVAANNTKGHDVCLPDGTRIEVKSRMLNENFGASELFGVLREPFNFSKVAFVVFGRDYSIVALRLIDESEVRAYSRWGERINGWQANVQKVLAAEVPDYTPQAIQAWNELGELTAVEPIQLERNTQKQIEAVYKKPRLWFQRDWVGQNVWVEFTTKDGESFRYPHDTLLESIVRATGAIKGTRSWEVDGVYHVSHPSRRHRALLEPYLIETVDASDSVKGRVQRALAVLNAVETRCTYNALRGYSGAKTNFQLFPYLGKKRPEASWVVRGDTGLPGKYDPEDLHPNLTMNDHIVENADELASIIREREGGS